MALEPGTQVEAQGRRGGEPLTAFLVILVVTTLGCAPSPAEKAAADIRSMNTEVNAKTLVERGKAFAAIGDQTRAEEYLAASLDAGADPRDVLPLLFDVCIKTGRYRSAVQHGENHLRKHPHDLRTRVMVGTLYAAINESKLAKRELEKVVDDEETTEAGTAKLRAEAHYLLGVVARDSDNDVVAADRHFREYLRVEPKGPHSEEARSSLLKSMPKAPPIAPPTPETSPAPSSSSPESLSPPPTPHD